MAIPQSTTQKLKRATAFHNEGRLAHALALYDEVLAEDPGNFDALCLSTLAEAARGDLKAAAGRIEKALAIRPDSQDALNIRGDLLMSLGQYREAVESFRRALRIAPHAPHILNNLGNALSHAGSQNEAVAQFDAAIAIDPNLAPAHYNRGVALREIGRQEDAVVAFRNAVRIEPRFPEAFNHMGSSLMALGRFDSALKAFREAIDIKQNYGSAWFNSALALTHLGRPEEAIDSLRAAIRAEPGNAEAWYRLGRLQQDRGEFTEAAASFRKALEIDPGHNDAGVNLSVVLLRLGRFGEAWPYYDHRLITLSRLGGSAGVPRHPDPSQLGGLQGLQGRHLLVMGEQGLGDEILFASMVPDIVGLAAKVTLLADSRLVGLFRRSFPKAEVHPHNPPDRGVIDAVDVKNRFLIGSLARWLRTESKDFPGTPYLLPNPERLAAMEARLKALGPERKVGIMWRGGAGSEREQERSIALAELAPLMEHPAQWVSLSHIDGAEEELDAFHRTTGHRIAHWPEVTRSSDYDDLAALLGALDAVVCVTCSAAHFAAAVGTETHVLVPRVPNWYYGTDGSKIPWYDSMILYRRTDAWPLDAIALNLWGE